jgi:hypothetical protein
VAAAWSTVLATRFFVRIHDEVVTLITKALAVVVLVSAVLATAASAQDDSGDARLITVDSLEYLLRVPPDGTMAAVFEDARLLDNELDPDRNAIAHRGRLTTLRRYSGPAISQSSHAAAWSASGWRMIARTLDAGCDQTIEADPSSA